MPIKELKNLKATHVSYVRKGANKKEFFLMKSESENPSFEKQCSIIVNKSEDEKRLVYGVVYEPEAVDTQGEFAKAEEIEKAAHLFLTDFRNIDLQHNFNTGFGQVAESYIAPVDFNIEGQKVKKGSWVLVTKASEDVWREIKKGAVTGYSMAGTADRLPVLEKSTEEKEAFNTNRDDVKGFFDVMKSFFGGTKQEKSENLKEDTEMKKEELQEMIKEAVNAAVAPVNEKLNTFEKKEASEEDYEAKTEDKERISKEDLNTVIKAAADAIEEALKPIEDRLKAIEKARGPSRQEVEQPESLKKSLFADIEI